MTWHNPRLCSWLANCKDKLQKDQNCPSNLSAFQNKGEEYFQGHKAVPQQARKDHEPDIQLKVARHWKTQEERPHNEAKNQCSEMQQEWPWILDLAAEHIEVIMIEFQRFRKSSGVMDDIITKLSFSNGDCKSWGIKHTESGWCQIRQCRRKTGKVEHSQESHLK